MAAGNLNWAEYGVRIGCKLKANLKLNAFVDGLAGSHGVDGKLHVVPGIEAKF